MNKKPIAALTALLWLMSAAASAGSSDHNIRVSGTVPDSNVTVTTRDCDFGVLSRTAATSGSCDAMVTVDAAAGVVWTLKIDAGRNCAADCSSSGDRRLLAEHAAGLYLGYRLYRDAGLGTELGDGGRTHGGAVLTQTQGNAPAVVAPYFEVDQVAGVHTGGTYSDTIHATVSW